MQSANARNSSAAMQFCAVVGRIPYRDLRRGRRDVGCGAKVPAIETGFERTSPEYDLDFHLQRYGQTGSTLSQPVSRAGIFELRSERESSRPTPANLASGIERRGGA